MYIVCRQQTMAATTPILRIDLSSQVPVYRQIASGLRILLVGGGLPAGSRLPTTRELAMDLGVHRNTVAEAYRILADEGWLELRRRHGATVLDRRRPASGPEARARWTRRLEGLVAEGLADGQSVEALASALEAACDALREGRRLAEET
jgi:DNA-binding transcriptional regulator YhcF (GntR family)